LDLWEKQWSERNKNYANFIIGNTRSMIEKCFGYGGIVFPVLWLDGKPIAAILALADKDRFMCFLGGRDMSLNNPSPGLMLHMYAIRWAIANGFRIYDLG